MELLRQLHWWAIQVVIGRVIAWAPDDHGGLDLVETLIPWLDRQIARAHSEAGTEVR